MLQGVQRLTLAVGCLVGALMLPRVASACSCAAPPLAGVSWPLDGATDVATDSPIVISRYGFTGKLADSLPVLAAEGGKEVALLETTRTSEPNDVCGLSEYLFLRPAHALEPGVRYTLGFADAPIPLLPAAHVSFTTGSKAFEPEPPVSPDVLLLAVYTDSACTRPDCPHLNQLRVDLGAQPPRTLWLQLHSDAPRYGDSSWIFLSQATAGAQSSVQQSVALSPADGCIDIRILGVEGRALYSERRCKPDRCAVYTRIATSTCGGLPFSDLDAARVPAQSCENPPLVDAASGMFLPAAMAPEPAPAAPPARASSPVAAAGGAAPAPVESQPVHVQACSVLRVGEGDARNTFGVVLLASLIGLRTRRRAS